MTIGPIDSTATDPASPSEASMPSTDKPMDFAGGPAFEVLAPAHRTLPFVLNSPPSGNLYPSDFLAASRLDCVAIRRSEDSYVDELLLPAAALGAPLMRANFPRAWLDVNREPYEL